MRLFGYGYRVQIGVAKVILDIIMRPNGVTAINRGKNYPGYAPSPKYRGENYPRSHDCGSISTPRKLLTALYI